MESNSVMEKSLEKKEVPGSDPAVQNLLPFMEKQWKEEEANKGKKREPSKSTSETKETKITGKTKKYASESDEDKENAPQQKKSCDTRKTIRDLKSSRQLDQKAIAGKVVQKSNLILCKTQRNFFFFLGLADDTASIEVKVYGTERYKEIIEGSCYLFRDLITEVNAETLNVKVIGSSKVSETNDIRVPTELMMEARELIDPQEPVRSVAEAKASPDKTKMSLEGTITEMTLDRRIEVRSEKKTLRRLVFRLEDKTGSIRICLWGDQAKLCRASVGDSVRVTNVCCSVYMGTISMRSTVCTRVYMIQAAAPRTGRVKIIGVMKANETETTVEAELDGQIQTFVVASKCLAEAFDIRLGGDFKKRLCLLLPLDANAEIQSDKIKAITKI